MESPRPALRSHQGNVLHLRAWREDFTDLPQEMVEKYTQHFLQAYDFVQIGSTLMPIPLGE